MRVLGITGSVGAGKSFLLEHIKKTYPARIVMADLVAHEVMEKGQPCYEKLVSSFGSGILQTDGSIDRQKLAEVIFSSPEKRTRLNQIVHPAVKEEIRRRICEEQKHQQTRLFVIEAALLLEDGYQEICEEIWYIYTSEEKRRERLKKQRGYSEEKIRKINASQSSEEFFKSRCQQWIDNNGSQDAACAQLDGLLEQFLKG